MTFVLIEHNIEHDGTGQQHMVGGLRSELAIVNCDLDSNYVKSRVLTAILTI